MCKYAWNQTTGMMQCHLQLVAQIPVFEATCLKVASLVVSVCAHIAWLQVQLMRMLTDARHVAHLQDVFEVNGGCIPDCSTRTCNMQSSKLYHHKNNVVQI